MSDGGGGGDEDESAHLAGGALQREANARLTRWHSCGKAWRTGRARWLLLPPSPSLPLLRLRLRLRRRRRLLILIHRHQDALRGVVARCGSHALAPLPRRGNMSAVNCLRRLRLPLLRIEFIATDVARKTGTIHI